MRTEGGQEGGKCLVLIWDRAMDFDLFFNLATILEGTVCRYLVPCLLAPAKLIGDEKTICTRAASC